MSPLSNLGSFLFVQANPLLHSLYCSSTMPVIEALVPVARYHLRRRRLRQAEVHLRAAKQLLLVSRCLPNEEAEVLLELARVLRVQVRGFIFCSLLTGNPPLHLLFSMLGWMLEICV